VSIFLQNDNLEMTNQAFQAMQATHQVYVALQDLNANFRNVILPESVKAIQGDEQSVIATLEALDGIIHSPNMSLDGIVNQLEILLRNAIMGMEVNKSECSKDLSEVVIFQLRSGDPWLSGWDVRPWIKGSGFESWLYLITVSPHVHQCSLTGLSKAEWFGDCL
jgi:hypothetical protein